MIPWHRVSVVDTQSGIGKLLTSFSWNLLKAKIWYSLSKCKSCRLSINNCVVLSMLVAEIKWKQMNFTCQNKLVFVFLSCILVSNYVHSRHSRLIAFLFCRFVCVCIPSLILYGGRGGGENGGRQAGIKRLWYTCMSWRHFRYTYIHENEWWISPMMNYKQYVQFYLFIWQTFLGLDCPTAPQVCEFPLSGKKRDHMYLML